MNPDWEMNAEERNNADWGAEAERDHRAATRAEEQDRQNLEDNDLLEHIIAFESGELDNVGVLRLFSYLIETGMVWHLQGTYGRTAHDLMDAGHIDADGVILTDVGAV